MPISRAVLVRSTIVLVAVVIVALFGIVAASFWLVEQTAGYSEAVLRGRQLRTALADMFSDLQAAEAGQRGFLLTEDRIYLTPFQDAHSRLPARIERLRYLATINPEAKVDIDAILSAASEKLTELQRTVELAQSGQRQEALAVLNTDAGQKAMDQVRDRFRSLLSRVDSSLAEGVADQRQSVAALRWTTAIGGLVIIAAAVGLGLLLLRYAREINAARRELESTNDELERRVDERTADLTHANEEIQRFAYIVTHDLRAPLVNIMGYTAELETSVDQVKAGLPGDWASSGPDSEIAQQALDADIPEALRFIRSSTAKMDGLINAILKLSREGRRVLKAEPIELHQFVEAAASTVQHQVGSNGGEVVVRGQAVAVKTDRLSLEQIVGNLLDNATKYRNEDRPLRILIGVRSMPASRVRIEVEDNGRGIAAQDHQRIFDLFRRSGTQDKPGEGIGLAHVRALVRNLGGDISVRSKLGEGTTFTIDLPRDLTKVTRS